MGSTIKTLATDASVEDFINSVENTERQKDGFTLLEMFTRLTGQKAKMWGPSIIGFGQYHYKSERSRQEGDWPLVGFSPRKQALTLYIMIGFKDFGALMQKLGKHKTSVSCLYINKLADVDLKVLEELISKSYVASRKKLT